MIPPSSGAKSKGSTILTETTCIAGQRSPFLLVISSQRFALTRRCNGPPPRWGCQGKVQDSQLEMATRAVLAGRASRANEPP
jgi:hypothetical protein